MQLAGEIEKSECAICGKRRLQNGAGELCETCQKMMFLIKTLEEQQKPKVPKIVVIFAAILYYSPEIFYFITALAAVQIIIDGHYWIGASMILSSFLVMIRTQVDK